MKNEEWRDEAEINMKQAFGKFICIVDSFDLSHDDQIDSITKFVTEAPTRAVSVGGWRSKNLQYQYHDLGQSWEKCLPGPAHQKNDR